MFSLYYDYPVNGDVLFLVNEPSLYPDRSETKGDVTICYQGDKIVGINIFKIGETVKLKTNGLIVTPDDKLVDVINAVLAKNGVDIKLDYYRSSGYQVGKIVSLEEHPLDAKANIVHLDFGDGKEVETFSRYPNLEVGKLVVCVRDGAMKFDGTKFKAAIIRNIHHDVELCSGKELRVNDDLSSAFIPEGYAAGDDFFLPSK